MRNYRYSPPAGWTSGAARALAVYPAVPRSSRAMMGALELLGEGVTDGTRIDMAQQPYAAGRLSGTRWRARVHTADGWVVRHLVVLDDGRYLYPLRLDTVARGEAEALPMLDEVARSVEPIGRVAGVLDRMLSRAA